MSTIEHMLPVEARHTLSRQSYLFDSVLAIGGAMLVTGVIYLFQLYPRIPNISIVYLLAVLALASTRGRYAAILASLVAFLSFDYFLVPPLYVFTINRVEEWVALFVFLVTAILQPDRAGTLHVEASAYQPADRLTLSSDEKAIAAWVMAHGRAMGLYDDDALAPSTSARFVRRVIVRSTAAGRAVGRSLRLIPLKLGEKVVGVLRLRVLEDPRRLLLEERLEEEHAHSDAPTSFFWTFLDQVTALIERARLQRENLRIAVLQRTDALRAALLSSVSHDLRTPLTSIKAAASSLLQEDVAWDDEERRGFAQAIEGEADRLNRLVGNLLDMSRIEEGALRPEKEEYSLAALIHDVLGRLEPLLEGRVVRAHLPPDDLLLVELDYLQIDQVLTNLLENAVRYTPAGSPIDVSAQIEGKQMVLRVADRGPGIPPTDLERVFDKFYRVLHGQHPAGYPMGSGLGLAVCKGLVEAHGGRIWAELREGGGLIVCVLLPVGAPERTDS